MYFLVAHCIRIALNFSLVSVEYKFGFEDTDSYLTESLRYQSVEDSHDDYSGYLNNDLKDDPTIKNANNFYKPNRGKTINRRTTGHLGLTNLALKKDKNGKSIDRSLQDEENPPDENSSNVEEVDEVVSEIRRTTSMAMQNVQKITFYINDESEIRLINNSTVKFYKIQVILPKENSSEKTVQEFKKSISDFKRLDLEVQIKCKPN